MILIVDLASPNRRVVLADGPVPRRAEELAVKADAAVVLPNAIETALHAEGRVKRDLTCVVANIGPGGLSATRAGVTFANAFAFGLGLPLAAVGYLDLLAREAAYRGLGPALCVKRAANDTAFAALSRDGTVLARRFGRFAEILPALLAAGPTPSAALGVLPPEGDALLPRETMHHPDIASPSESVLAAAAASAALEAGPAFLTPINELSPDFAGGIPA